MDSRGWIFGAFVGVERRLTDRLSLNIDAGPYYGRARASDGAEGAALDLAVNTSLYCRLGRRRR